MAKVDVILIQNVVGLGAESDHVKVAAGYARNFLFPQKLAIPLTSANKRRLEALRQRRGEREAHELNSMTELSKMLSKVTLLITVKTGEESRMFGSVTAGTIADELKHQFEVALDKHKIHLEKPIKAIGDHDVELRLHPEVTATLKVRVQSSTPEVKIEVPSAEVKKPEAKGEPKREGRREDRNKQRVIRSEREAKA
jgi:large subunit ribosomal protein L9